jgi:PAS domain-containing protein
MDWSATPLGPRADWPEPLKTVTNLALSSSFAMAILWGEELIFVYNNGYRVIAGDKHPRAMGMSTREIWPEVWEFNKPIFERVMQEGQTVHLEDQLFRIQRNVEPEDAYFTLSYSPIWLEEGLVGGTLVTLNETTQRKQAEHALRDSEEMLRLALDAAGMSAWEYDLTTLKVTFSKNAEKVLKLPRRPENSDQGLPVIVTNLSSCRSVHAPRKSTLLANLLIYKILMYETKTASISVPHLSRRVLWNSARPQIISRLVISLACNFLKSKKTASFTFYLCILLGKFYALRSPEVYRRSFGQKPDHNMQFGGKAQKLMHYSR